VHSSINFKSLIGSILFFLCIDVTLIAQVGAQSKEPVHHTKVNRERMSLNENWRFIRYDTEPDSLVYDTRPAIQDRNDNLVADTKPTESVLKNDQTPVLKEWILPVANSYIKDPLRHYKRPEANSVSNFPFVQFQFNETEWQQVNLPHDWAIAQPFYTADNAIVGGGMGRLPVHGVGWYRKKITIPLSDKNKQIYLDIDGAMSYAMVWLNGKLVGGWPYGYNSFRLELTPFIKFGEQNQLAIRLDNPTNSARWYPGGGLYRNVWLTKMNPIHVAYSGTAVTTQNITTNSASIDLKVDIENSGNSNQEIEVASVIYAWDAALQKKIRRTTSTSKSAVTINNGKTATVQARVIVPNPLLWQPRPSKQQNLYVAVTQLFLKGVLIDEYETVFGIRSVEFHPLNGISINGKPVRIQGVNQHHDLGALGAAFNTRAAKRQLEILAEAGCNAIRMAHNPPAPELLELTDQMGFLVIDEIFDSWERKKTPHDFHLIFPDWYEADTRNFIRRDRNHPSVIMWSFGNEVGEQYTEDTGVLVAKKLYNIVKEEDSTRPAVSAMNYAKPEMLLPAIMDIITLNYQGEGIRDAPAYSHLRGIKTPPLYPAFQKKFPGKLILSSETASALSTRGTYIFPVFEGYSAPVSDTTGGDPVNKYVSAYELYTAAFGSSADKVFASQDKHPFVAGEFVWSGWDYLGEPTPYYSARSSYCGFIDLAGFKKDRFYLYQARWRPHLPMAHILPHWNWHGRIGKITPVHVFTSGDEAELFLNGKSLGKKKKEMYEYRLRWDDVIYEPGTLKVIAYKNKQKWAEAEVTTTDAAAALQMNADRSGIHANGQDLSFITVTVTDKNGLPVPDAQNKIAFTIDGPAEIVATDNGNPADMVSFSSKQRNAFSGLALVIIKSKKNRPGIITVKATADGLKETKITVTSR
jgi:beta-galactosidase